MKIIIVLEKYGGFANRLFQSLHFHAFAIENKILFFNPTILGLLKFDNKFFYFLDYFNNLFLKFVAKIIFNILKNNNNQIYFGKNSYIRFVRGWDFRVNNLTEKYYEELKFSSPDCSHLDMKDAPAFTRNLLTILEGKGLL